MKKCMLLFIGVLVVAVALYGSPAHTPVVQAAGFDPNNITSDSFFTARDSMSVSDIQNFLVQKGSVLAYLNPSQLGEEANGRSAAQIIYDASRVNRTDFASSQGYGPSNPLVMSLNPQVILVTLQKEQSLITGSYVAGSSATNSALRSAMGYGCPDSGGCDDTYAGFNYQVTYAAAQFMKNYYKASSSPYKPGQTYTITNTVGPPHNAPASQQVYIGNAATSSLYQYTPHVYNGNYNFWYFSNSWFSEPPFKPSLVQGPDGTAYFIDSGYRWPITAGAFEAWGFSYGDVGTASADDLALPVGTPIKPIAIDENDGSAYLVQGGKKRVITSERVFALAGLSWANSTKLPHYLIEKVPYGLPVYPLSMISGGDGSVYLATAGVAYPMTGDIYTNAWGYNTYKEIGQVPSSVLTSLPRNQMLTRLAIAVNTDGTVFLLDRGYGYKVSAAMASAWNLDLGQVRRVDNMLLDERGNGGMLTDLVTQAGGDGTVYKISGGQKRPMSGGYWRAQGYSSSNVRNVSASLLGTLPTGSALR